MDVSPETVRHMDHAQREMRCLGDACGGDVHEVFQAPGLFGIPNVTLALETQALVVPQRVVGALLVAAEQKNMPPGVGVQVHRDDDDDIQRVCECLVEHLRLVQTGLDVPLHRGLFAVWGRDIGVLHFAAIRAMRPPPGIGASLGDVPYRIVPQLGNQVQVALPRPLQGVVVPKVPVQHHRGQRDISGDKGQQGVEHTREAPSRRREGHVGLGCVLTAFWTSQATLCRRWLLLLRVRFGLASNFLRVATDALLDPERARAALLRTDQRSREKGQAGHWLAVQTGEEPIQTIGVLASFRDHHCIPSSQVHLL